VHGDPPKVIGIYFPDPLSIRTRIQACFFETGALSACPDFFDLVFSPWDQRGRSCSRNRRRGFGIGADNGRFRISEVSLIRSCVARLLTHTPLFAEKIFCPAVIIGETG
jgi:hypothetical protein